jgi:cytochrome c oxidase assembly factor CtaG
MIQHMLLVCVAAPLMAAGRPTFVLAWGVFGGVRPGRRSIAAAAFRVVQERWLWKPAVAWGLFAFILWTWHHPILYEAALHDPFLHDAQHLSFFLAAYIFWRPCLDVRSARALCAPASIPYLFTASIHTAALGVFLTLSPRHWYAYYATRTEAWELTPLEDQQLAGLIMWIPGCLVFPAVAAILFGEWLTRLSCVDKPRVTNSLDVEGTRTTSHGICV